MIVCLSLVARRGAVEARAGSRRRSSRVEAPEEDLPPGMSAKSRTGPADAAVPPRRAARLLRDRNDRKKAGRLSRSLRFCKFSPKALFPLNGEDVSPRSVVRVSSVVTVDAREPVKFDGSPRRDF